MVKDARRRLQVLALKANTLMPGQSVLGNVKFDLPKAGHKAPAEFTAVINLAGVPMSILFREGPPVIDTTPHAVSNAHPAGQIGDPTVGGAGTQPHYGVSSPVVAGTIGHGDSEYVPAPLNQVPSPKSVDSGQDVSYTAGSRGNTSTTITGRFTGRSEQVSTNNGGTKKFNCEYAVGNGNTVWHTAFGSCPGTWEGP
jgi:hypothetical protein